MQTNIAAEFQNTPEGIEAESVLRKCVHCGFCTATCPTYQLLGDELDGPRGRIYQIKQVLEGADATEETRLHLDRCLTCRACETTCPSGVQYGRLLDIGRDVVETRTQRPMTERTGRWLLDRVLSRPAAARVLFTAARLARPLLPPALKAKVPRRQAHLPKPGRRHRRTVIVPGGCVQPALTPRTNQAAALLLDRLGVSMAETRDAGCCGSLPQHLSFGERARDLARRNVDAWWPAIENGAEAIISTATGCGVMVTEYAHLLRGDPAYAERAEKVSELACDLSQFLAAQAGTLGVSPRTTPIAFHAPCTYQHGLKLTGTVEAMLDSLGYRLTPVADAHLCCGSAGTYSLLQPAISGQLLENKLNNLMAGEPQYLVTANVGCQSHLASRAGVPVLHWAELLAEDLGEA